MSTVGQTDCELLTATVRIKLKNTQVKKGWKLDTDSIQETGHRQYTGNWTQTVYRKLDTDSIQYTLRI
jgi:hypothetical protein